MREGIKSLFVNPFLSLLDMQNLRCYFHKKPLKVESHDATNDYTILVPLWGKSEYLTNYEYLEKYKEHVIICTSTHTPPELTHFLQQLEHEGFRVFRTTVFPIGKWTFFSAALELVTTKYAALLDADSTPMGDLGELFAIFEKEGYDIASTNVIPKNTHNLLEKLQKLEYSMCMLGRWYYPFLTSGACISATTDAMKRIRNSHSNHELGEDIEFGKLAKMFKMKIGYVDFKVATDVPSTFKRWFNQRNIWFAGHSDTTLLT